MADFYKTTKRTPFCIRAIKKRTDHESNVSTRRVDSLDSKSLFWILLKKLKIRFWFQESGFGF